MQLIRREKGKQLNLLPAHQKSPVLLIAEDNDDEFALASGALSAIQTRLDIRRVPDGEACIAYLNGESPYTEMPFPDLLLLDINMPQMNGFGVMQRIDSDAHLRHLPVVIFSSSAEPEDVNGMYRMRCNSYVRKPMEFDEFQRVLNGIVQYWFSVVTLPAAVN